MNKITLNGKDVNYLDVDIKPYYWSHTTINGQRDSDERPRIPFSENGRWKISIDMNTGKVLGWPSNVSARVRYIVEDCEFTYRDILDTVTKKFFDVPDFLRESGAENVMRLVIDNTGHIVAWSVTQSDLDKSLR